MKNKKNKKFHVKNTGQPDPQPDPIRNPIDPNPILTHLKWPVFDPWPDWPNPNPTRPARFAMSRLNLIYYIN